MAEYTILTDENFAETLATIHEGVILVHKKLCPHCKNMQKVMERFWSMAPQAMLALLDSEEAPRSMECLQAERVPTLVIVKDGQPLTSRTGLMNPAELLQLYQSSLFERNLPQG